MPKQKIIKLSNVSDDEYKMIDKLKKFYNTKTRSKVLRKALVQAYNIYKDMKP